MPFPGSSYRLPCCIEAPAPYADRARYALRMLLLPLGIDPVWVGRDDLAAPGLYYGPDPDAVAPSRLRVRLRPDVPAFFDARTPLLRPADWIEFDGERWPLLFGTAAEPDWIASAFFWLSGWQEHVVRERDVAGRFPHAASLQARLGTTTRPVVDAYRTRLAADLAARGVPLRPRTWHGAGWAFCPTHDVDALRKWRPGILYREVVQHALLNRRREAVAVRARRLARGLADWLTPGDPYRTALVRLMEETRQRGGTATFFLKTAARGAYDVPYREGPFLRRCLRDFRRHGFEVGLHPSYFACDHPAYVAEERARLAGWIGEPPVSVRSHYLRFAPVTARLYEAVGFRIDSTLGFAEHEGFRHGTCLPFQVFDVEANRPLDLWEMPLVLMEGTLFNRRFLSPEDARRVTDELLATCRRFGGVAVMLWHNAIWDDLDHPGWGRHFTETLDEAVRQGAALLSLRAALESWLGESLGR